MNISYLGHSCFKIESRGASLVIDPYAAGSVPGLCDVNEEADMVLCSHEHHDHNGRECVKLTGRDQNVFSVKTVDSFHDDEGGSKRGKNIIHVICDGEVTLVHLGDQGCELTEYQLDAIGEADVLLVPVGGFFTIDADTAASIAAKLGAAVTVPMHYRTASAGFDVIAPVDGFLDHFADHETHIGVLSVNKDEDTRVVLLSPINAK